MTFQKVKIEKMVYGGDGLGYLNGRVVFIPFSAPGDELSVEVVSTRKGVQWGEIKEIITPSPVRVTPFCPHFGTCGGCQWQHIAYPAQVELKTSILADTLSRLGGIRDFTVNKSIPSPQDQGYRHRVKFHVQADGSAIGFYRPGTHSVVPIKSCPMLPDDMNDIVKQLSAYLAQHPVKDLTQIQLMKADNIIALLTLKSLTDVSWIKDIKKIPLAGVTIYPKRYSKYGWGLKSINMSVCKRRFQVSGGGFFQANLNLLPSMVNRVLKMLKPGDLGVEFFSGIGVFGVCIQERIKKLITYEANKHAVHNAYVNLRTNKTKNIIAYSMSAEAGMRLLSARKIKPDVVLLDPPREGLSDTISRGLLNLSPKQIIYISCNPATLARDLKIILASNQYRLAQIQPLDMFPHSFHIETITNLIPA